MKTKEMYTPKEAGQKLGVTVKTIHRWDAAGKLKVIRTAGNQKRIPCSEIKRLSGEESKEGISCAIYARVSSQKQSKDGNLTRQKERLIEAAKEKGYEIGSVIGEQASGLNEKRKGLKKLFGLAGKGKINVVLIEFKDRLARFGFAYIEKAFELIGVKVEALEELPAKEPGEEMVQDLCAIITVFSARMYGSRAKLFKEKIVHAMKECNDGRSKENN